MVQVKNSQTDRVTVAEASIALNMNVESIRYLMQQERLPIGYAMIKPNKKKWTYYIFRGLLDQEVARLKGGGERKW